MSGYDLGNGAFDTGQAAAAIGKSFIEEFQRGREKIFLKELEDRKALAAEFEKLAEDQALDEADRRQAMAHARALRLLMPEKKRPKEYLPDEKLRQSTGDPLGIPAMVPLLYKKVMKEGPKQPEKPAAITAPPSPTAPGAGGPGSPPPGMTTAMPPMPSMPGGESQGPNAISPAPGMPGMPDATAAPAMAASPSSPSLPSMPPMPAPPEEGWEPKFRTREQIAEETARVKTIENRVTFNGEPADLRTLAASGRQQTAAIQMLKMGYDPTTGEPVDVSKLPAEKQAGIAHRRAQMELIDAQEEYTRTLPTRDSQKIQVAWAQVQVAQQNAQTAASRAMIDAALYGNMLGGMPGGPGQGLLGAPTAIDNPIASMAEQVLTKQIEFSAVPAKLKPLVSLEIAQNGGVIVPQTLQSKLMQFTEAREAVDTIYDSLESYIKSEGTGALWAGYSYKAKVDALTRLVGRSLGEKGVFTDADKADFTKILSPGTILSLTNPERAQSWVREVEGIMNRVEAEQLQGFYQRVYSRKDGTLDTFKPGSTKNVVRELGGETTTPAPVATTAPTDTKQRLDPTVPEGTKKQINGRWMIRIKNGWRPVQ